MRIIKSYYKADDGNVFVGEIARQGRSILYQSMPPAGYTQIDELNYNNILKRQEKADVEIFGLLPVKETIDKTENLTGGKHERPTKGL